MTCPSVLWVASPAAVFIVIEMNNSIKNDMKKGLLWSAIEKYSGLVVSTLISMVLARLLTPTDFGIVAICTVLIAFLQIFCTMGIGPAVIQRKDLTQEDLDSIFTFSLIVGFFFSVLFFVSSWGIAAFYKKEILIPICQILSINLFFASANIVPSALMAKNKRFKEIAKRTLLLLLISGPIAIVAAFYDAGVYALLISPIFTSIGVFLYNRKFYRLSVTRHVNELSIHKILSFSIYQFLFELENYFLRNIDKLIIGMYMSPSSLGYYEKSYRLMQLPLNQVTSVIGPVIQPIMSSLENNMKEMARVNNKIVSLVATISFPLSIFLYYAADEIILLMFGDQWSDAIPCFKIMALSGMTQMILSTSGGVMQASNAAKLLFKLGFVNAIVVVSCFIIAAAIGGTILSMAWGWTIGSVTTFFITYIWLYRKLFNTSFLSMLRVLLFPALTSVILTLFLFVFNTVTHDSINVLFSLLIKVCAALIIPVGMLLCTKKISLTQIKNIRTFINK